MKSSIHNKPTSTGVVFTSFILALVLGLALFNQSGYKMRVVDEENVLGSSTTTCVEETPKQFNSGVRADALNANKASRIKVTWTKTTDSTVWGKGCPKNINGYSMVIMTVIPGQRIYGPIIAESGFISNSSSTSWTTPNTLPIGQYVVLFQHENSGKRTMNWVNPNVEMKINVGPEPTPTPTPTTCWVESPKAFNSGVRADVVSDKGSKIKVAWTRTTDSTAWGKGCPKTEHGYWVIIQPVIPGQRLYGPIVSKSGFISNSSSPSWTTPKGLPNGQYIVLFRHVNNREKLWTNDPSVGPSVGMNVNIGTTPTPTPKKTPTNPSDPKPPSSTKR